jgi:hypothetical protein
MKLSANMALLVLVALVATAGAFSPHSLSVSVSTATATATATARSLTSSTTTTARHATIEKQETGELVAPKSMADMLSHEGATMDLYGANVQKTYG